MSYRNRSVLSKCLFILEARWCAEAGAHALLTDCHREDPPTQARSPNLVTHFQLPPTFPTMRPVALSGHSRALTQIKYSHEGDLLFTAAKDASPSLWYTHNGERVGSYDGPCLMRYCCEKPAACALLEKWQRGWEMCLQWRSRSYAPVHVAGCATVLFGAVGSGEPQAHPHSAGCCCRPLAKVAAALLFPPMPWSPLTVESCVPTPVV